MQDFSKIARLLIWMLKIKLINFSIISKLLQKEVDENKVDSRRGDKEKNSPIFSVS